MYFQSASQSLIFEATNTVSEASTIQLITNEYFDKKKKALRARTLAQLFIRSCYSCETRGVLFIKFEMTNVSNLINIIGPKLYQSLTCFSAFISSRYIGRPAPFTFVQNGACSRVT